MDADDEEGAGMTHLPLPQMIKREGNQARVDMSTDTSALNTGEHQVKGPHPSLVRVDEDQFYKDKGPEEFPLTTRRSPRLLLCSLFHGLG